MVTKPSRVGAVAVMYVSLLLLFNGCNYKYIVTTHSNRGEQVHYVDGTRDMTFKVFENKGNALGYYDDAHPRKVIYLEGHVHRFSVVKHKLK